MASDPRFVKEISKILAEQGTVSEGEALAMQDAFERVSQEAFDQFLLDEGLVDEDDLLKALSEYYQVPAFSVGAYFFDTRLLRMFPKSFLLRNALIPVERDENMLIMVAAHPSDENLLPKIGEHVSYDIRFHVGIYGDICDAVKEFYDKATTEEPMDVDLNEKRRTRDDARRAAEAKRSSKGEVDIEDLIEQE